MTRELTFFSINIHLLRRARRWSQEQLASALGVQRTTISNWEKRVSVPGFQDLLNIANTFGVTLNDLVAKPETDETRWPLSAYRSEVEEKLSHATDPMARYGKPTIDDLSKQVELLRAEIEALRRMKSK